MDNTTSCAAIDILFRANVATDNVSSILSDDDTTTKADIEWLIEWERYAD